MMAPWIAWRKWRSAAPADDIFAGLFGQSDPAFWLDSAGGPPASTPDACLLLADRMLAFDHEEGAVYGLCLVGGRQDELDAEAWLFEVEAIVTELGERRTEASPAASQTASVAPTPVLRHDRGA